MKEETRAQSINFKLKFNSRIKNFKKGHMYLLKLPFVLSFLQVKLMKKGSSKQTPQERSIAHLEEEKKTIRF